METEGQAVTGALPNGLILTGEGRRERAKTVAAAYLCGAAEGEAKPCGSCAHCRKVRLGIHPDLMELGKPGEALKVDDIRAMRRDAVVRPNEAERKLYLLTNAETMNSNGQNAMLKLLEEGPDYAAFLLLTPNPETLLPTVRSRCQIQFCGGEEDPSGTLAQSFAALLISETTPPLTLAEFLVDLEKQPRETITALLEETIRLLLRRVGENPPWISARITALEEVRLAGQSNISPGHMAGWLMSSLCGKIE